MAGRATMVVLATAPGSLAGLADRLRGEGLEVREVALLSFGPPADWAPVDQAIFRLPEFKAVAVTSPRAAGAFTARVAAHRVNPPRGQEAWASGAATAEQLRDLFDPVRLPSSLVTLDAGAGSLLASAMLSAHVGSPVLFPCGDARRDELPAVLRAGGIVVEEVVCYRSVLAADQDARRALVGADVLLVSSPRVATLAAKVSPRDERPALVAIGPTTAAAARAAGWAPAGVAKRPTVDAVVERIRALAKPH
ncbi:MAG TPA: uroporphyrinogen-III synthase [Gemmatimonadales bacterium]|nr:uroporphyrinogen-III synthase [Gemmatimonadales bacterium]